MIRVNAYAIRLPTGLRFQKQFSKNIYGSESCHSLSCSFAEIVFSISTTFPASDSLLHVCSHSSSCHNVFILLSLSGVTNLSLLAGVWAACILAYRCLQMKWWAAVTVVAILSQKALLMCPYISPSKFQCSYCVVLVPFCIIYSLYLIAVWYLQAIWLLEGSLQLPSFLAFCVSKGRASSLNTSLRTLSFILPYHEDCRPHAIWRVIDIALLCPRMHTSCQEFSVINPSILLQDLRHTLIRCLISLLLCAVLYVITFTPSFISSPECVHLSPSTCKPLFMFLHLILCCPSSYCIPHAIIKCRMTILISYFPCLAARFFPHEDCSIRQLAPLFAYLQTWNSLIRQNIGSLIR